jgi:protein-S-isoprenylcysteine O-methyltransferase Ste14
MSESKDIRNNVPMFLMMGGVILLTIMATLKLQHWQGWMFFVGVVLVGSYLFWLLSESNVSTTEAAKGETSKDKGTCELYAFGRLLTVFLAMAAPTLCGEFGWHTLFGIVFFYFGIFFRLNAISTLGRFYSHRVRLVGEHQVIDTGPYKLVRHPAYTGMLAAHLGFVMVFFNFWAFAAFALILVPAVVMRILVEEKALYELPGYPAYAETHKRLVPLVW